MRVDMNSLTRVVGEFAGMNNLGKINVVLEFEDDAHLQRARAIIKREIDAHYSMTFLAPRPEPTTMNGVGLILRVKG